MRARDLRLRLFSDGCPILHSFAGSFYAWISCYDGMCYYITVCDWMYEKQNDINKKDTRLGCNYRLLFTVILIYVIHRVLSICVLFRDSICTNVWYRMRLLSMLLLYYTTVLPWWKNTTATPVFMYTFNCCQASCFGFVAPLFSYATRILIQHKTAT